MLRLEIEQDSHQELIVAPHVFSNTDRITIHTDGACGKDGVGGWACCLQWRDKLMVRFGCAKGTTSNVMELTAIKVGLSLLKNTTHQVTLFTDSQYCKNAITEWAKVWRKRGWVNATGQPVKNLELMQELLATYERLNRVRSLSIIWIRGHQDKSDDVHHKYNCMVDDLATKAKKKFVSNHRL